MTKQQQKQPLAAEVCATGHRAITTHLGYSKAMQSGRGEIGTAFVDGASALVRLAGKSPLKLVVARERGPCVRVHSATFGGGMLAGDDITLNVAVAARSHLVLGSSAPCKVYRSQNARASQLSVSANVEEEGICALTPAPVACFAGAHYRQRVEVDLQSRGNLLLVDTFTAGRAARGERWAFERFDSRTRIRVDGKLVLHDALLLEGEIAKRFGPFDACSLAVVSGPRFPTEQIHAAIAQRQARRDDPVAVAASLWPWGVVVRAAAREIERLEQELRTLLAPAFAVVANGDAWHDPW